MVLLASAYDQSKYFKAADLTTEKKLKIKSVTEELIGQGADQKKMLVVWFTNDERGLPPDCGCVSPRPRAMARLRNRHRRLSMMT
jgi:hypothetical protein